MSMNEKDVLFEISVLCQPALSVRGESEDVVMIPFTGTAEGPAFNGCVIGPGVDTQVIPHGEEARLSARYMLEGTDAAGAPCRVFIQNEGSFAGGFRPRLVTDSPALGALARQELSSDVTPIPGGVRISIHRA